jgi:phytoene synthase
MTADDARWLEREMFDRCDAILKKGSRSFYAASRLLPLRVRRPTMALYAFCRHADDAVDDGHDPLFAVARLEERLERVYRGRPGDAVVDRAFAWVVERFAIPRALPNALLEGMEWDARGRRYENVDALEEYAARVASSVGAMMTLVMGPRGHDVLARACDLGVAMQLTNVARDVGEDARQVEATAPRAWLREEGVDPDAWLARPALEPGVARVIARTLSRADELYVRADAGVAMLPKDCRVAIRAARLIYSDIGARVRGAGYDSVSRRAVVPTSRKLWLVVRALLSRSVHASNEHDRAPALPAVRHLIAAAAASAIGPSPRADASAA